MEQRDFNGPPASFALSSIDGPDRIDFCYSPFPFSDHPNSREPFFFPSLSSPFAGGIESYLDPKYISDPSAFASRLPFLPLPNTYAMYDWGFEPAFIRKRNERERQRVKCVNDGYSRLREHLPHEFAEKRLSKVETLRAAIQYIKRLQEMLGIELKTEGQAKSHLVVESSPESDKEKRISVEKYPGSYSNDDAETRVSTPSSKDDGLSICSGENEDPLTSLLSSAVKVEAQLPADKTFEACRNLSCDYTLKGKIFYKAANDSSLCDPRLPSNLTKSSDSCCWVGRHRFDPMDSERKLTRDAKLSSDDNSGMAAACNYTGDVRNKVGAERSYAFAKNGRFCSRKEPPYYVKRLDQHKNRNCFVQKPTSKGFPENASTCIGTRESDFTSDNSSNDIPGSSSSQ